MFFMQANFDIHPTSAKNTLTIGVTQSGETADTIAAIDIKLRDVLQLKIKHINLILLQ